MERRIKKPKKRLSIKEMILHNAGEIQHYTNILETCFEEGQVYVFDRIIFAYDSNDNEWIFPYKISSFILKERELKSGIKTPMARYLAWKRLKNSGN